MTDAVAKLPHGQGCADRLKPLGMEALVASCVPCKGEGSKYAEVVEVAPRQCECYAPDGWASVSTDASSIEAATPAGPGVPKGCALLSSYECPEDVMPGELWEALYTHNSSNNVFYQLPWDGECYSQREAAPSWCPQPPGGCNPQRDPVVELQPQPPCEGMPRAQSTSATVFLPQLCSEDNPQMEPISAAHPQPPRFSERSPRRQSNSALRTQQRCPNEGSPRTSSPMREAERRRHMARCGDDADNVGMPDDMVLEFVLHPKLAGAGQHTLVWRDGRRTLALTSSFLDRDFQ